MVSGKEYRLNSWIKRLLAISSLAAVAGGCVATEESTEIEQAEVVSQSAQAIELGARRHRISEGGNHALAIGQNGTVWTWGYNGNGQLGNGTPSTTPQLSPVAVANVTNAVSVAAGSAHSLVLRSTGRVLAWGANSNGQIGNGTTNQQATPMEVPSLTDVVSVAAGQSHSLALKNDGTVWGWGYNGVGQLGNGLTGAVQATPVQVMRNDTGEPLRNIVAIAAGMHHSVAVRADGTVWAWGYNLYGQLGNGTSANTTKAVSVASLNGAIGVAAGQYHTAALLSNGTVKTWGYNGNGQLGNSTLTNSYTPVLVPGIVDAKGIAAGNRHTMALKADGSAIAWGYGYYGQLGNNNISNQSAPVAVASLSGASEISAGAFSSCALLSGGGIRCWGFNSYGELGNGGTGQANAPSTTNTLSGIVEAAGGDAHSVAVKWDGTVWSWGLNNQGQLGDGSPVKRLAPVQVRLNSTPTYLDNVTAVAAGSFHSVALRADGTVWSWGDNDYGQCGDGTMGAANRVYAVQVRQNGGSFLTGIVAVRAGSQFSMALRYDGKVFAWGRNQLGQVGMADMAFANQSTAQEVQYLDNVVAIAAGGAHAIAVTGNGTSYAWGNNSDGQLSYDPNDATGPTMYTDVVWPMNGAPNVSAISAAAGTAHTLILMSNGSAYGCGDNQYGQLGTGDAVDRWDLVPIGGLDNVERIAAGGNHSLAMFANGYLYSTGRNLWGQLGNGGTMDQNVVAQIPSFGNMTGIAAGLEHSIAVKPDGSIWTWGRNNNGQLGNAAQNAVANATPVQNAFN